MTEFSALSLWQPWATLIAQGYKHYETRGWYTKYRGELLICAAKKKLPKDFYCRLSIKLHGDLYKLMQEDCPRGVAIALVDLVDCIKMTPDFITQQSEKELLLGDWKPGRYAWKLENVRSINNFPVKGQQGIFQIEEKYGFE